MGRPRSFDRDLALDVALGLFWTHGYEGVSIADLTTAIGIAPPSLYAAFGDKRQLFQQAVALYEAREGAALAAALNQPGPARPAIAAMLAQAARAYVRGGENRGRGCLVSAALLGSAAENAEIAAFVRDRRAQAQAAIRTRLLLSLIHI